MSAAPFRLTQVVTDLDPRVAELVGRLTLEEKLAQLVGWWERAEPEASGSDGGVAPLQESMSSGEPARFEEFARHGLGQLTRPFGTAPIEPIEGARRLAARQRWLVQHTRPGLPALVHEECLTGLAAWRATTFPAPPCWGASFDPDLVERMGASIGASMVALGVHQGLAPVLDVVRDPRWGRVEECIAEDPYVVATIATAYVRGMQSTGVVATLKHFVGYSASQAGRNLAPVHAGPREIEEVLMPPFEMAVLDGEVDSVMNSYAEIDGLPVAADAALLTGVLRDRWGFAGTVVADYFSVAFLERLHGVAADAADAAGQALTAGIDVELPTGDTFLAPLAAAVRAGVVPIGLVDRALMRVLDQKVRLGLLDATFDDPAAEPDLDPAAHREIAARLAEESVVLLANDGVLPLGAARIAVVGPNADDPAAMMGCYSFANHVLAQHPGVPLGIDVATVVGALRSELPGVELTHVRGCDVDSADTSGFAAAVDAVRGSDVAVVVVGDRAGLFGRGTSGEGCDTDDLELPGVQRALVEELLMTGTPVVLVLLTGRPYVLGWALERCAAVVQAFFPGQEGGPAVAAILSGRVCPSGRLPMSLPRSSGAQPYSYLHPPLGADSDVSAVSTAPTAAFGSGLSYTTFAYADLRVSASGVPTDGAVRVSVTVANTGDRRGAEVVQLYGHDPVASTTRPVTFLVGYARVELDPGERAEVCLGVPARRFALCDRSGRMVVEPGRIDLAVGRSCADPLLHVAIELTGPVHPISRADPRVVTIDINPC